VKVRVQKQLKRNIAAFGQIANFSPYIAGSEFTMADCAATVHLPLIGMATKAIYGEDMMAAYPVRDYMQLVGERPTVKKVTQDRKANAAEKALEDAAKPVHPSEGAHRE
jgi:glutathione S-transferase